MLQNSYISHNKSPYNTHIFSYKAVFKSTAVLSNRIAVDSCGKRWGQGLLSHSRWAQVDRFGCDDVSRIIQQLRSIPCNNQSCDGGGWWNDACEVCLRRRNGYLRLVVVWEPSLMASWLMCCRSSVVVFFSVVGGRRSRVGKRRGGGGRLELAVIDEKDALQCTHFLTPVTHVLCHNNWFLCSAIFRWPSAMYLRCILRLLLHR